MLQVLRYCTGDHTFTTFLGDRMLTETWTHKEEFGWMEEEGNNSHNAITYSRQ